jgi:hypothetical protein
MFIINIRASTSEVTLMILRPCKIDDLDYFYEYSQNTT